ncbi:NAD(P)/FAD-dependent oxidoreductase [Flavobacterium phycosphaerae]|uniref:NAD(P)/FAD-dependent oxidoreductase n=1 Tax=Flavobacterium phycosphaerae TaxID=2697515 RepID=UPI00138B1B15|nr:NAD(P)/FAD-dependent oxidoreductase [Flavobacterium phycosphaerae]
MKPVSSRRQFIKQSGLALTAVVLPISFTKSSINTFMNTTKSFDVIIIGGSYSGLAAAMALGRALKQVLVIDSGHPCNAQTPYSHNFLTQDGNTPKGIASIGKEQVAKYPNINFFNGIASKGTKTKKGFDIETEWGEKFQASKIIFATGIKDVMPKIAGFEACWGISVLHCPYCHGYEVRDTATGILGNGDYAFELAKMIANWTGDLTIYTNGQATLTTEQLAKLQKHHIKVVEKEITKLDHNTGHLKVIVFTDGSTVPLNVLYSPRPFVQHCTIPESLGCEMNEDGYIKVNGFQETTIDGVYACGDNTTRLRAVANAVAMGTTAGMAVSKKLILEQF